MKHNMPERSELILGILVIAALILLINPFNLLMTSAQVLTLVMILAVTVIAFAVFVWREQPQDEREAFHSLKAGRIAYFVGGSVLVLAIVIQAFAHKLDYWLAITLGAMVLAKVLVSAWSRRQ